MSVMAQQQLWSKKRDEAVTFQYHKFPVSLERLEKYITKNHITISGPGPPGRLRGLGFYEECVLTLAELPVHIKCSITPVPRVAANDVHESTLADSTLRAQTSHTAPAPKPSVLGLSGPQQGVDVAAKVDIDEPIPTPIVAEVLETIWDQLMPDVEDTMFTTPGDSMTFDGPAFDLLFSGILELIANDSKAQVASIAVQIKGMSPDDAESIRNGVLPLMRRLSDEAVAHGPKKDAPDLLRFVFGLFTQTFKDEASGRVALHSHLERLSKEMRDEYGERWKYDLVELCKSQDIVGPKETLMEGTRPDNEDRGVRAGVQADVARGLGDYLIFCVCPISFWVIVDLLIVSVPMPPGAVFPGHSRSMCKLCRLPAPILQRM
jgi:hypothetical protein